MARDRARSLIAFIFVLFSSLSTGEPPIPVKSQLRGRNQTVVLTQQAGGAACGDGMILKEGRCVVAKQTVVLTQQADGWACGDGMHLKNVGNVCAVGVAQVLHIKGSWEEGCETCGNNLVAYGYIRGFSCKK